MPYAAGASTRRWRASATQKEHALATPNYGYEKRQRELAKKRKAEEKKQKKQQGGQGGSDETPTAEAPAEQASDTQQPPAAG
jgi:hypothetical protein